MNKYIKIIAALILGLLLLTGGIAVTIGWNAVAPVLQQYGLQVQAADNINKETSSGQYAMNQREEFAELKSDIDAMKVKIQNQRTQIKNYKETHNISDLSYQQERQYNRMINRLLGYRNQYQTYVAEYNADMNVSYKRQYAEDLPLDMEEKFWTGDLIP